MIQFVFPSDRSRLERIKSVSYLRQMLQEDEDFHYYRLRFKISILKDKYINCRCKDCKSVMTFRRDEERQQYVQLKFENVHFHVVRHSKVNIVLSNFIKELPDSLDLRYAKLLTKNSFPAISDSKFYYFYQKIKSFNGNFGDLIKKLDLDGNDIVCEPYDPTFSTLPNLLLIISPQMKEDYMKYGTFVTFDLTFHLIKQKKHGKIFKVGAFLGLSMSRKITPFGLAVLLQQTKESFYQLFKNFGQIMGKNPSYIITDESSAMISAIKQLNSEGYQSVHILDIFHLLRNIRKRLKNKTNLKYFTALLRSKNSYEFEIQLSKAYEALEEEQIQILTKLVRDKSEFCYSQVPVHGVMGFTTTTSINEKFHDLVKCRITHEQPYIKSVMITLKIIEQLSSKNQSWNLEKFPLQNYYGPQIKQVRYALDKRVFQQFCIQLQKVQYLQVTRREQNIIQLQDAHLNILFNLKMDEIWKCSCKFNERSGIPCNHVIKACLVTHQRITKHINSRWLINSLIENKIEKKRISTGRLSRRNRR